MLKQYGNNCYLTSFLHLISLTSGDWKCYEEFQCVDKMIDNLQQDKCKDIDNELVTKINDIINKYRSHQTVKHAKDYFLKQLGLNNDIVSFEFDNSDKRFVISENLPNLTGLENPDPITIYNYFNPFINYEHIMIDNKEYRIIGFILSTGIHHFVIGRLHIYYGPEFLNYVTDFCKIDPIASDKIVRLTDEEKNYYGEKITSMNYQISYILYERV